MVRPDRRTSGQVGTRPAADGAETVLPEGSRPGSRSGGLSEVPSTETEGRQDRKTSPRLAGEAGIEPATRGFGDRRSTTELHPYEMVLWTMTYEIGYKAPCLTKIVKINRLLGVGIIENTLSGFVSATRLRDVRV